MLAPLHVSADHHVCRHQDRLMASMWHPDKCGKIPKKLSKISYPLWNVITKNCSNLKAFDREKDSPNHGDMRCFCARARHPSFFNFLSSQKILKKYISHTLRYVLEDGGWCEQPHIILIPQKIIFFFFCPRQHLYAEPVLHQESTTTWTLHNWC